MPIYLGVSEKYGKNKLYKIIEALVGHELTLEEEARMDSKFILSLVGKQCFIVVENVKKGEKCYNNILAYSVIQSLLPSLTTGEKEKAFVNHKENKLKANAQTEEENPLMDEKLVPGYVPADNTINASDLPF